MVHRSAGTFDVPLPGIEGRQGGGTYTLVFTFANNLTSVGGASVTSGGGNVRVGTIGPNPNQYTVNLTGVPNQQYLAVTLRAVQDAAGNKGSVVGPAMGVLVGDVNTNGIVTTDDLSLVQAQAGKQVNSSNFRDDVNVDGFMSGADADAVRSQIGRGLPTPTPTPTSTSTSTLTSTLVPTSTPAPTPAPASGLGQRSHASLGPGPDVPEFGFLLARNAFRRTEDGGPRTEGGGRKLRQKENKM